MSKRKTGKGGVILSRSIVESEIWRDKPAEWLKIFEYFFLMVNHTDNGKYKRGQGFFRYAWIVENNSVSRHVIAHCVRWLKTRNMIRTQRATHGFIVTVVNYDAYQSFDKYRRNIKATDAQPKSDGGATEAQRPRNNIHNNDKNDKNDKYCRNSDEFRLASLLFSLMRERKKDFKQPNLQTWSKHIDRMIRLDERKPAQIEAVIRWSQQDSFWQNNILSTDKLREQFDRLEMQMGGAATESDDDQFARIAKKKAAGELP